MANTPKRVAIIGLDCAMLHLIERHVKEGNLPAFKKLLETGVVAENCLAPFPTITPPNWTAIATGAYCGTSGVTDFHYHKTGRHLDNRNIGQAFGSDRVEAQTLWEALDKIGKKSIVMNYPCSWPPKGLKNSIMVGGAGMVPGEDHNGFPRTDHLVDLSSYQIVSTDIYPGQLQGEFRDAEGWRNVPDMGEDPLEMEVPLLFRRSSKKPAGATWHLLVLRTGGSDRYNQATLSPSKDYKAAFCTLSAGHWSSKITTRIKMEDGSEREVFFKCKLLELSEDAEKFTFLIGTMTDASGWTYPEEVARELVSQDQVVHAEYGMPMLKLGEIDLDTFMEMCEQDTAWMGEGAATLMKNHEWDLFIMHEHSPDFVYHVIMSDLESADEGTQQRAWDVHRRLMVSNDRMLAKLMEAAGPDTLFVVVSDHGATADGPMFDPYQALIPAGLSVMKTPLKSEEEMDGQEIHNRHIGWGESDPDYSKSKAVPQRTCYVYVNLKGRDPDGIVEPEDYERVQQEIIDALYSYIDPKTGKRPVALALTKRDARIFGHHGDRVGDVVYAIQPWFGSQHGPILPTAIYGVGSLHPILFMSGPGMKKGHRMQRTCWLTDIVPTVCYLMNWPVPKDVEGAIVYQLFENPHFRTDEIERTRKRLAEMNETLKA